MPFAVATPASPPRPFPPAEQNWGWSNVKGSCGGHDFKLGPKSAKNCSGLHTSVKSSTATIWASPFAGDTEDAPFKIVVHGDHVHDRVAGPSHRLDLEFAYYPHSSDPLLAHGLIAQSFADSSPRYGMLDIYPKAGTFTTAAQAEGAIEGTVDMYEVALPFETDFAFSLFAGKASGVVGTADAATEQCDRALRKEIAMIDRKITRMALDYMRESYNGWKHYIREESRAIVARATSLEVAPGQDLTEALEAHRRLAEECAPCPSPPSPPPSPPSPPPLRPGEVSITATEIILQQITGAGRRRNLAAVDMDQLKIAVMDALHHAGSPTTRAEIVDAEDLGGGLVKVTVLLDVADWACKQSFLDKLTETFASASCHQPPKKITVTVAPPPPSSPTGPLQPPSPSPSPPRPSPPPSPPQEPLVLPSSPPPSASPSPPPPSAPPSPPPPSPPPPSPSPPPPAAPPPAAPPPPPPSPPPSPPPPSASPSPPPPSASPAPPPAPPPPPCAACGKGYMVNGEPSCCDNIWTGFGLNCKTLQSDSFRLNCAGCSCPGDPSPPQSPPSPPQSPPSPPQSPQPPQSPPSPPSYPLGAFAQYQALSTANTAGTVYSAMSLSGDAADGDLEQLLYYVVSDMSAAWGYHHLQQGACCMWQSSCCPSSYGLPVLLYYRVGQAPTAKLDFNTQLASSLPSGYPTCCTSSDSSSLEDNGQVYYMRVMYDEVSPTHRVSVIVHEYLHVAQKEKCGDSSRNNSPTFSLWLLEGAATATEHLYLDYYFKATGDSSDTTGTEYEYYSDQLFGSYSHSAVQWTINDYLAGTWSMSSSLESYSGSTSNYHAECTAFLYLCSRTSFRYAMVEFITSGDCDLRRSGSKDATFAATFGAGSSHGTSWSSMADFYADFKTRGSQPTRAPPR